MHLFSTLLIFFQKIATTWVLDVQHHSEKSCMSLEIDWKYHVRILKEIIVIDEAAKFERNPEWYKQNRKENLGP